MMAKMMMEGKGPGAALTRIDEQAVLAYHRWQGHGLGYILPKAWPGFSS
jgi:hypothetical protein